MNNEEYQQVAAIVCLHIDTLLEVSNQDITLKELKEQIKLIHSLKEEIIIDAEVREKIYNAACMIFTLIGK